MNTKSSTNKEADEFTKVQADKGFCAELKILWLKFFSFCRVTFKNFIFFALICGILYLNFEYIFPEFSEWKTSGWAPILVFAFFEFVIVFSVAVILDIEVAIILFTAITAYGLKKHLGIEQSKEKPKNKS